MEKLLCVHTSLVYKSYANSLAGSTFVSAIASRWIGRYVAQNGIRMKKMDSRITVVKSVENTAGEKQKSKKKQHLHVD